MMLIFIFNICCNITKIQTGFNIPKKGIHNLNENIFFFFLIIQ